MTLQQPGDCFSVAVIIVNWNLAGETAACIDSLQKGSLLPLRIFVVDNGSTDDSAERLRRRFGADISLIQSPRNLGFSGGNNVGIQAALAEGFEWIFLVNNDTVVAADCLAQLRHATTALPNFRVWGPLILYYDEPERIWALGDRALAGTLITRGVLRNAVAPAALPAIEPVDYLTACGLLVHREVFEDVGLLDESFFMYAEDADFCRRAQEAGFRLACATRARMWHKVSRSTGVHHPASRYWRTANQIRFYRRYSHGVARLMLWLFTVVRLAGLSLRDLLQGRRSLLGPTWRAWVRGWFGSQPV